MIPIAVELTDFLSHRSANGEPVTFDFEGAVLWSVSGDNGAGKSAIFDAILWTLYGQHRGGSQDSKRLISHGAEQAGVAQGLAFGLMNACWGVGALVGPAAGGALAGAVGDSAPYLILAGLCLATYLATRAGRAQPVGQLP